MHVSARQKACLHNSAYSMRSDVSFCPEVAAGICIRYRTIAATRILVQRKSHIFHLQFDKRRCRFVSGVLVMRRRLRPAFGTDRYQSGRLSILEQNRDTHTKPPMQVRTSSPRGREILQSFCSCFSIAFEKGNKLLWLFIHCGGHSCIQIDDRRH